MSRPLLGTGLSDSRMDLTTPWAPLSDLKLMRAHSGPDIQIKAAGGARTLDDLLPVMSLGVTRTGATATIAILDAAKERGIGDEPTTVTSKLMQEMAGGY